MFSVSFFLRKPFLVFGKAETCSSICSKIHKYHAYSCLLSAVPRQGAIVKNIVPGLENASPLQGILSTRQKAFPLTTKCARRVTFLYLGARRITFLYLGARRITFLYKTSTVFLKQGTSLSFPLVHSLSPENTPSV